MDDRFVHVKCWQLTGDVIAIEPVLNGRVRSLKGEKPAVDELPTANPIERSRGCQRSIDWGLLEESATEAQDADIWVFVIRFNPTLGPDDRHHIGESDGIPTQRSLLAFRKIVPLCQRRWHRRAHLVGI